MAMPDELDSGYEYELYDQLPPRAREDVADVAAVLTYEYSITIDTAMPMANRMRREERARFDRILHQSEEYALREEDGLECSVCGLTYQSNAESGIFDGRTYCSSGCLATMGPQAKGKGKGFEPFSGTGRRLNDLDS